MHRSLWFAIVAASMSNAVVSAGGAVIVGRTGDVSYPTIQAAVDDALDGEVILIASGTYPGFEIRSRSLAVFAAPGASVAIDGQVLIRSVRLDQVVVVTGLQGVATTAPGAMVPAEGLRVTGCKGHVRVENCSFTGDRADAVSANPTGGAGGSFVNSTRVVLSRTTLTGGVGLEFCLDPGCGASEGGIGLATETSTLAIVDCQLLGGPAGYYKGCGGDGGHGAVVASGELWLAGSNVQGASGEFSCLGTPGPGGDGGNGLWIQSGTVHALDTTLTAGLGVCSSGCGVNGAALVNAGTFTTLPGTLRRMSASNVVDDASAGSLTVTGLAGDEVFVPIAQRPGFLIVPALARWWLIPYPAKISVQSSGTIPGSGTLIVPAPALSVLAPSLPRVVYAQLSGRDSLGAGWLGDTLHRLVLDRDGAPDCDANNVLDYLDALEDPARDCNGNLVIDSCEVSSGTTDDCNANGIPDECDVASGTSTDLNGDDVPDECQPSITLWVDAAAPGGGDGSAGAPFQTLSEALSAATPSHVLVLVRDGLYNGPGNRNLDFGGKTLFFKSTGGAANCVIDCELADRLAIFDSGEGADSGWQGFTIRNGASPWGSAIFVDGANTRVLDCVIEACVATGAAGGGALYVAHGTCRVRNSAFSFNTAWNGPGGAIRGETAGTIDVARCTFAYNSAPEGGAIALDHTARVVMSHSILRENSAMTGDGGAVRAIQTSLTSSWFTAIDCVVAGNTSAGRGGAAYFQGVLSGGNTSNPVFQESTLVANSSGVQGGAIYSAQNVRGELRNTILWSNTAPQGAQMAFATTGVNGATLRSCVLEGGTAAIHNPTGYAVNNFSGLTSDPAFVDPDGIDDNPSTFADNDYHLGASSPCIDSGDNAFRAQDSTDIDSDGLTSEYCPFDVDLAPRLVDVPSVPNTGLGPPPHVDRGAYERQN